MYLSKVYIKNIRCFKEITVSFDRNPLPCTWNVILGDNSSGKTCFLRCLAIGLCDEVSGAALMKELYGSFIRDGENEAKIRLTLIEPRSRQELVIETLLERNKGYERISQRVLRGRRLRDKVFVCGYGIQRSILGDTSFNEYSILEAVYTLFNYDSPLQNPEIILNRQKKPMQRRLLRMIGDVLMFDSSRDSKKQINKLVTTDKGIVIKTPAGDIFLEDFGDGYRTSFTWLLDFIGWQIYGGRLSEVEKLKNITGIILLDELELHLHPRLQRNIVNKLKSVLPNVQFILTTHSPLIVSSIGELFKINASNIIHFSFLPAKNDIQHYKFTEDEVMSFKGLEYDQLLASRPFDYQVKVDKDLEKVLIEASKLAGKAKERTPKESKKYSELKEYLKRVIQPSGDTEFVRDIQKELYSVMRKNVKQLERRILNDKS